MIVNIKHLSDLFTKNHYEIAFGGTDNHLFLLDMRSKGVDGARM